ncbi:MAG: lytic transglycosylase domain-containing protein [Ruminococcaceae bacterium]|nr:lytic transglycosylase domain-containing protein [Oscillospiraceae bacterium]
MTQQTKRIIAILLIFCLSIGGGILINEIWTDIERRLYPVDYGEIITNASEEFDVPEYIIYATVKVESDFDPDAVSTKGALGLMQMMPSTFEWLTGDDHLDENLSTRRLDDPEVSIRYGTYYLSYLYKKFNYNWDTAFAAYNAGEGNVTKWLSDEKYSDGNGGLSDIPYKETKKYVKKINDAIENYKKLYPVNT